MDKKSAVIPWAEIEERYVSLFPSGIRMPAKPLQVDSGERDDLDSGDSGTDNRGALVLDATCVPQ